MVDARRKEEGRAVLGELENEKRTRVLQSNTLFVSAELGGYSMRTKSEKKAVAMVKMASFLIFAPCKLASSSH